MADVRMPAEGRGAAVRLSFDGREIVAYPGETVAAALWAAGVRGLRQSVGVGEPRGVYCSMGVCYDCLVTIEGRAVRACMTPVKDGMVVESSR